MRSEKRCVCRASGWPALAPARRLRFFISFYFSVHLAPHVPSATVELMGADAEAEQHVIAVLRGIALRGGVSAQLGVLVICNSKQGAWAHSLVWALHRTWIRSTMPAPFSSKVWSHAAWRGIKQNDGARLVEQRSSAARPGVPSTATEAFDALFEKEEFRNPNFLFTVRS